MPLPAKFIHTHYYLITGQYTYAGDLVLIPQVLYFFPVADLEVERNKRAGYGGYFGAAAHGLAFIAAHAIQTGYGSYVEKHGLWRPGITAEQFRSAADEHIARVKADRTTATFTDHLPFPTRIEAKEMSQHRLGAMGTLSFHGQSDVHDLKVGLRRKKQLREALWESGIMKF